MSSSEHISIGFGADNVRLHGGLAQFPLILIDLTGDLLHNEFKPARVPTTCFAGVLRVPAHLPHLGSICPKGDRFRLFCERNMLIPSLTAT